MTTDEVVLYTAILGTFIFCILVPPPPLKSEVESYGGTSDFTMEEINLFYREMSRISNLHPYKEDVWDCSNMSIMLARSLRGAGFNAKYCYGNITFHGEDLLHGWVEIYYDGKKIALDPTSQSIISKKFYWMYGKNNSAICVEV